MRNKQRQDEAEGYFIPENYKNWISRFGISPLLYSQVIPICSLLVFLIYNSTPLSSDWKLGISIFLCLTITVWSVLLLWKYDMSLYDFLKSFILFVQSTKLYRLRKPSEEILNEKNKGTVK